MKRLTDAQVVAGYTGDPELPKGSLRADHLQAREDVGRLVEMLRDMIRVVKMFNPEYGERGIAKDAANLLAEVGQ